MKKASNQQAPRFAQVSVTPQNFEAFSGAGFIAPYVSNAEAMMAANLATPSAFAGTGVHSVPVSYLHQKAHMPNNIGVSITPQVVIQ